MTTELQRAIESGFESIGHYEESMRDFDRVLDYLDRAENISEERKELYHRSLDEIGMDGVFELARNTNKLFKELGINSYRLQREELSKNGRKSYELGVGVHAQTPEEMSKNGRIGGRVRGRGFWQTHPELLEEICELKYEQGLTWKDTTDELNRRNDTEYTVNQVRGTYHNNKHLLADKEE